MGLVQTNTRRIQIGGRTYDADPATLAEMERDGVKWTEVPVESPYKASIDESAGDALRGAAHGATLGLIDAKVPGLDKSLPEAVGLAPYEQVRERSPVAATGGDLFGSAVSPVGALGKAGQGAGLAVRAGREALSGALQGGVRAAAEGDDAGTAALIGGGLGGAVGAGAAKLGDLGGQAVNAIGGKLGEAADAMRSRSVGVLSKEAKALADRLGVATLPKEIAALVERVSPSGWQGKSAAQRVEELGGELKNTYGPKIDQVLKDAGTNEGLNAFVPQSWTDLANQLGLRAGSAASSAVTDADQALASALERQANRLGQQPAPADLVGLRQAKTGWQKQAHTGPAGSVPDNAAKQATQELGNAAEGQLDYIMSHALPETEAAFHQANKDFGERALIRQMAKERAGVEATDSMFPALVAAAGGGMIGGMTSEDPVKGAALGVIAGGLTGTRNQALQQLSKSQGLDALANVARALQRQSPAAAQGVRNAGQAVADRSRTLGYLGSDVLTPEEEEALR